MVGAPEVELPLEPELLLEEFVGATTAGGIRSVVFLRLSVTITPSSEIYRAVSMQRYTNDKLHRTKAIPEDTG